MTLEEITVQVTTVWVDFCTSANCSLTKIENLAHRTEKRSPTWGVVLGECITWNELEVGNTSESHDSEVIFQLRTLSRRIFSSRRSFLNTRLRPITSWPEVRPRKRFSRALRMRMIVSDRIQPWQWQRETKPVNGRAAYHLLYFSWAFEWGLSHI
jgi:hypothetical protein